MCVTFKVRCIEVDSAQVTLSCHSSLMLTGVHSGGHCRPSGQPTDSPLVPQLPATTDLFLLLLENVIEMHPLESGSFTHPVSLCLWSMCLLERIHCVDHSLFSSGWTFGPVLARSGCCNKAMHCVAHKQGKCTSHSLQLEVQGQGSDRPASLLCTGSGTHSWGLHLPPSASCGGSQRLVAAAGDRSKATVM